MPAPQQRSQDPLTDRLGELEGLLEQQAASDVKQQNSIPILDELVGAEDYLEDKNLSAAKAPIKAGKDVDRLARQLVDKLETRLTIELAQAMRTLKDRLKGSIMEELQATIAGRAKPGQGHKQHGADNEAPR